MTLCSDDVGHCHFGGLSYHITVWYHNPDGCDLYHLSTAMD